MIDVTGESRQMRANNYGRGYTLGSNISKGSGLGGPSALRTDQTGAERIAEQRANFFYGGSVTGAEDAQAALRGNMQPHTDRFGALSQGFSGSQQGYADMGAAAGGREAPIYQQGLNRQAQDSAFARNAANQLFQNAQQGPGPSAAQAQLNASTAQAMRQQLSLAGSGRGAGGGASAFRQAAANQAQIQGAANAQAANLRAQEEAAWRQQQAGMIAQAGGLAQAQQAQDLAAAGYYTGAQQQQTQLNDAAGLGYGQLGLGYGQAALGAATGGAQTQMGVEQGAHNINMGALQGSSGYESLLNQIYGIDKGVATQNAQIEAQKEGAVWGAVGAGIGAAASMAPMLSDMRAKTDIKSGGGEVRNMLDSVGQGKRAPLKDQIQTQIDADAEEERKRQKWAAMAPHLMTLGSSLGTAYAVSDSREKRELSQENEALRKALSQIKPPEYSTSPAYPNVGQRALASELDRLKVQQYGPRASYPTPQAPPTEAIDQAAALNAVRQTKPWSYEYKNPERHGQGTHFGPMAQELAQTPVGRSTLTQTPDGRLAVDTGRLALVNTAALAAKQKEDDALRRELDQVKAKLKKEGRWEESR